MVDPPRTSLVGECRKEEQVLALCSEMLALFTLTMPCLHDQGTELGILVLKPNIDASDASDTSDGGT